MLENAIVLWTLLPSNKPAGETYNGKWGKRSIYELTASALQNKGTKFLIKIYDQSYFH